MFVIAFILFFVSRIIYLFRFPIFNDEAMYLSWGEIIRNNPFNWTISMVIDGKQPGLPLLLSFLFHLPYDPFMLGRYLSVFFSIISFVMYDQILRLYVSAMSHRFILLVLYTVIPYWLFYDRICLMESGVIAMALSAFYGYIQWIQTKRTRWGFFVGLTLGCGWWLKSTILMVVAAILFGSLCGLKSKKISLKEFFGFIFLMGVTLFITISPSLMNSQFANIAVRERERILSFSELMRFPFGLWIQNIQKGFVWLAVYMVFIPVLGIGLPWIKNKKALTIPLQGLLWFATIFIIEIFVSRVFTARYLVLAGPFLLLAYAGVMVRTKYFFPLTFFATIIGIIWSVCLIVSPFQYYRSLKFFPPAAADFSQYILGWPSGWGVREAIMWLKDTQKKKSTLVYIRDDSGNPESAVLAYLLREPNYFIDYISHIQSTNQLLLKRALDAQSVYFISRGTQLAHMENHLTLVKKFEKPYDSEYVGVYRFHTVDVDE